MSITAPVAGNQFYMGLIEEKKGSSSNPLGTYVVTGYTPLEFASAATTAAGTDVVYSLNRAPNMPASAANALTVGSGVVVQSVKCTIETPVVQGDGDTASFDVGISTARGFGTAAGTAADLLSGMYLTSVDYSGSGVIAVGAAAGLAGFGDVGLMNTTNYVNIALKPNAAAQTLTAGSLSFDVVLNTNY